MVEVISGLRENIVFTRKVCILIYMEIKTFESLWLLLYLLHLTQGLWYKPILYNSVCESCGLLEFIRF